MRPRRRSRTIRRSRFSAGTSSRRSLTAANRLVYGAFRDGIAAGSMDVKIPYTFTYVMKPTNVVLHAGAGAKTPDQLAADHHNTDSTSGSLIV